MLNYYVLWKVSTIWENLRSMLKSARTKTASKKMHFESKKDTNKKIINHINCSIIQGFSALRKAETPLVKKITIFFCFYANQLLTRHSHFAPLGRVDKWMAEPSLFAIHSCLSKFSRIMAAKTLKNPYRL